MAFGLGFNKAKTLAAAEKYVMQGKIPAAIQEYQKVLEHEPRDLVILNTVGDLYLRSNKTPEALTYFYKLGEIYVEDGFVRNGIAVFKKITRSDPNAIDAVSRLADLYTLQGQLNEARNYLNQAVELYSAKGEHGKCVELFEKLLMMDPENVLAKQKLAAVYEKAGKTADAAAMYFSAAEGFVDRANPVEADKALKKARELGYAEADTIVLEARILVDSGRGSEAITALERVPDKETNRGALNLLYHAHVSLGDLLSAGKVATSIFEQFDDSAGVEQVAATMIERGDSNAALDLYESVADRAVQKHVAQPLIDGLKSIVQQDRNDIRARRLLAHMYLGTGETGEYTDASEQLADVLSQQRDFQGARDVYAELARVEPANPMHFQRVQQMDQKLGRSDSSDVLAPDAPAMETGYTAALFPAPLDPLSQHVVETALSEADQQAVFLQLDEAIHTLETALAQVPGNIALNQKLVDVYVQAQRWKEAAAVCETLTESCVVAGDGENATKYGDLMTKYQSYAGGAAPDEHFEHGGSGMEEFHVPDEMPMGMAEMQIPASSPEDTIALPADFSVDIDSVHDAPAPETSAETREVDLSNEWEALMVVDGATVDAGSAASAEPEPFIMPADAPEEAPEEFTIDPDPVEDAAPASEAVVAPAVDEMMDSSAAVEEFSLDEFTLDQDSTLDATSFADIQPEPQVWPAETPASVAPPAAAPPVVAPPAAAPPASAPAPPVAHEDEEVSLDLDHPVESAHTDDFELSLDLDEPVAPAPAPKVVPAPPPAQALFDDLAGSLDASLGDFVPAQKMPPAPPAAPVRPPAPPVSAAKPKSAPPAPAPPAKAVGKSGLADVFAEFKEEMEQDSAVESDIENHYNMGVAFKEMGLFDEAIGEFQKAYHGAEHLPNNPNFIPVCTLLAHCFMEKKLPELAVRWLQNALKAPGLDREGEMALRYEIGSSQEMAGQKAAALDSFMQVYALNIDYRDVADRIRALKGN